MVTSERTSSRPRPLDAVDRRLLAELQVDGRLSVNELAARAQVARATAYQRLQRLEDDGVILRYTAVVDPGRVGLSIAALILVNRAFVDDESRQVRIFRILAAWTIVLDGENVVRQIQADRLAVAVCIRDRLLERDGAGFGIQERRVVVAGVIRVPDVERLLERHLAGVGARLLH